MQQDWAFPTNIQSSQGLALWSAVAITVAKRVWKVVGSDASRVAFDLLTETTDDTVFWPANASHYATLYSLVMPQIKSQLGSAVQCIGGNTIGPKKAGPAGSEPWIVSFLAACGKLGYEKCPLDIVAFHVFSPKAATSIGTSAEYVKKEMEKHLVSYKTIPRIAMTAWGFHGSGMYDFNAQPLGAAVMANGLISIENAPLEFAITYKWAGINCAKLNSPCLVVNLPGSLKPIAIPFEFHSRMRKAGIARISAECNGADALNAIAVHTSDSKAIMAMVAPLVTDADNIPASPAAPLQVTVKHLQCTGQVVTLTMDYVDSSLASDGSAVVRSTTVTGTLNQNNSFVANGASTPYEVMPADFSYAMLLSISCQ